MKPFTRLTFRLFFWVALLIFPAFLLPSCRQKSQDTYVSSDSLYYAADTAAQASVYFADPLNILLQAAIQSGFFTQTTGPEPFMNCGTLRFQPDSTFYPKTITLDFGKNCSGTDGRIRSGKIVALLSGPFASIGDSIRIILDSFYIGNIRMTDTESVYNISSSDTLDLLIRVTGGSMLFSGKQSITYSDSLVATELPSNSSLPPLALSFSITGSATMGLSSGQPLEINVLQGLIWDMACKYFTSGNFTLQDGNRSAVVDFGTGSCSGLAQVTINKQNLQIILPQ
ncbi:MAG TPA: hypothetical protein VNE41_10795 [Chitinophagaceae bacterium]|nr:hypothetical protein [Chitinophagaceae bacterium]